MNEFKHLPLLQLHEHLANLKPGVSKFEPDNALKDACLCAAKVIWDQTGLSAWDARPRAVQHFYEYGNGTLGFAHVNADHKDCFVMIIFDRKSSTPSGYLLFDIGAEYAEPLYICPAINHEGPPTEEMIENSIPKLMSHQDPFAVVDIGYGTYMQVLQTGENSFRLEHQHVNTAHHYESVREVSAQEAISALKSYAFGKKEWAAEISWKKLDL